MKREPCVRFSAGAGSNENGLEGANSFRMWWLRIQNDPLYFLFSFGLCSSADLKALT